MESATTDFWAKRIFNVSGTADFNALALEIFRHQANSIPIYRDFVQAMKVDPALVSQVEDIPFLPISFFKTHLVLAPEQKSAIVFSSSGTTGMQHSHHHVANVQVYERSFLTAFESHYGSPKNWCILALLPSYLEREGSSLIYMAEDLIKTSNHPRSGFYLQNLAELEMHLQELEASQTPTLLLGVSYALLDLAERIPFQLKHTTVMETGGMKGHRKEMIKAELHATLQAGFGPSPIHSEYGMTELLSQAYSKGNGRFTGPPWFRVLVRDANDPLSLVPTGQGGGLNLIDLANVHSCSFLATQDLGRLHPDGSFEVLGRFDHSDLRGCNLLVQ